MPRPKKRVHWTQTEKGKAILAARSAARTTTLKETTAHASLAPTRTPEGPFNYAAGYIDCFISLFAQTTNLSPTTLAGELGAVLSRKARGTSGRA
jgi:hypothetical protein